MDRRMGWGNAGETWRDMAAALHPGGLAGARTVRQARGYATATDPELMAWSAQGDGRAFDQVVVRHGPLALRVARRLTADPVAAEDIVQEAFVRAWSQAGRFDGERARLSTWLYRIVTNLAIDHRRRRQPVSLPETFDMADPSEDAEARLAAGEAQRLLAAGLAQLPPRHRVAVALVYEEGLSGAQTARLLGVSTKAVERLLARARSRLRDHVR